MAEVIIALVKLLTILGLVKETDLIRKMKVNLILNLKDIVINLNQLADK